MSRNKLLAGFAPPKFGEGRAQAEAGALREKAECQPDHRTGRGKQRRFAKTVEE